MLNLACKTITLEELIKCSFNINKTEYLIIKHLLNNKDCTSDTLQECLGKDLTTIQKALKSLLNKNIVQRRQVNLESGGYKFYYNTISKNELKEKIMSNLKNFETKVEARLNTF